MALEAMENEVDLQRKAEQNNDFGRMDKNQKVADRCYAIANQEHQEMLTEFLLHRNFVRISDVPVHRFEEPVKRCNCFKKAVMTAIFSDKKNAGALPMAHRVYIWDRSWCCPDAN